MLLTVVSALARLDLDPWQEAAKFAAMPRETATQRLASMIASVPDELSARREPGMIAARLIALLPHGARSGVTPRVPLDGIGAPANSWIVKYVVLVVAVMAIQCLVAVFQPPTPVYDAHASTATTDPGQKPPSVLGR
jgi:hypothetical protein